MCHWVVSLIWVPPILRFDPEMAKDPLSAPLQPAWPLASKYVIGEHVPVQVIVMPSIVDPAAAGIGKVEPFERLMALNFPDPATAFCQPLKSPA